MVFFLVLGSVGVLTSVLDWGATLSSRRAEYTLQPRPGDLFLARRKPWYAKVIHDFQWDEFFSVEDDRPGWWSRLSPSGYCGRDETGRRDATEGEAATHCVGMIAMKIQEE